MKLSDYIKDKIVVILLFIVMVIIIISLLVLFKVPSALIIAIITVALLFFLIMFLIDYYTRKSFYNNFLNNLNNLDQKYLITEILNEPSFYEGKILYQSIYEIDKSMKERINIYKYNMEDFKEYIEMWIHEIKIPISSLVLIIHNHKTEASKKELEQVKKIESYIEQVLYYVRSENSEKDYLIRQYNLKKLVNNVVVKNKDNFILNNIELKIENIDYNVLTDSKWLEFILTQIISNSLKYHKAKDSCIKISSKKENEKVILSIYDNGIGIPNCDIKRVFDKSFTGQNGRHIGSSTGMGLYICKSLCEKLGHKLSIESIQNEYTKVTIEFKNNQFYNVVK